MKARVKFAKTGIMKYVGHLDLMRFFQKAVRRSKLPIKYSEGFNPHQIMSFAAPLGVGITSDGEYMDIELTEYVEPNKARDALQVTMVEGVDILSFRYLPDGAGNAMASLAASDYTLTYKHPENFSFSLEELQDAKIKFFDEPKQIIITKKTKKGERELDLKPLVYDFTISEMDGVIEFYLFVSTGSTDNIKPELVLIHFFASFGVEVDENTFFIHRHDMMTRVNDRFVSLEDICG